MTASSRFTATGHVYLREMYRDPYFPDALVDKVRAELVALVAYLEGGTRTVDDVQAACDVMTDAINRLQDAFADAGSELETGAREDIAATLAAIFETYGIGLGVEDALRKRAW